MPVTPIDLRVLRNVIHELVRDSLQRFAAEHPNVAVSAIALYVFPYGRVAGLCFDTEAKSDSIVAKWNGLTDEFGSYNESPEDFAFPEYGETELLGFPDLYQTPEPLEFLDIHGLICPGNRPQEGDEGINKAMFPTLCAYMREYGNWSNIQRSNLFRVGVVMHDSACIDFWRVRN